MGTTPTARTAQKRSQKRRPPPPPPLSLSNPKPLKPQKRLKKLNRKLQYRKWLQWKTAIRSLKNHQKLKKLLLNRQTPLQRPMVTARIVTGLPKLKFNRKLYRK